MMRMQRLVTFGLVALSALLVSRGMAVETESWRQSGFDDFQQGKRERVALRSDGLLTLSPALKELHDTSADAVWALTADSKGNLYTASAAPEGTKLRIHRIPAGGGPVETVADVEGLACFAMTVDKQDRVYVGVSPEAKIFRITGNVPELFSEPPAAYVWAMAVDSKQNLYAATGDKGVIYKVDASGKASVFVESDETHVRSLLVGERDELYAGTAPDGLVLRISPAGESFVVYQAAREEVTSLALDKGGNLFIAAVGKKRESSARPLSLPATTTVIPSTPAPPAPSAPGATGASPQAPRPTPTAPRPIVAGGSDVVRIGRDGFPEDVWGSDQEIAYSLAVDSQDRVLVATGNQGALYRLEGHRLYSSLLEAKAEQITALLALPKGGVVFTTANIGKVFQAGPGLAESGWFESDVFDSEFFARWGRIDVEGSGTPGSIQVKARSGNVNRPQKNWSAWSGAVGTGPEGVVEVPPARYLQWRVDLSQADAAPELRSVSVAYRTKNLPPRIVETEATPPNYTFPPRLLAITPSDKLTLQPLAAKNRPRSTPLSTTGAPSLTMSYSKGYVGIRWLAEDDNNDELCYRLDIRPIAASTWLSLAKDLTEPQYSWDSSSWPDGRYVVKVTVSDKNSNVPGEALESSVVSAPFLIDNTKPQISGITAVWAGNQLQLKWTATDGLSPVRRAHYSLDGQEWTRVEPENGISDSVTLRYTLTLPGAASGGTSPILPGSVIAVRVADEFDNESVASVAIPAK